MERALLSLVSLFVLLCAPFEARAELVPYRDPLVSVFHMNANSCKAPEPSSLWEYYNRVFDREAGDFDTFHFDTAPYEPEFTEVDPYDTGGPFELTFSDDGDYEWVEEYYYGEYEEKFHFEEEPASDVPDVPVVVNDKVEKFITYFQTHGRKSFTKWLERSGGYLTMVKGLLRERGLPEDLAYLALIESGFNPIAISRAKASGIWQFMRWTGRRYGLRVDWWIDERFDPEKATVAAARYLEGLYERFDSWYLAAAGYNGGEGRIISALKRYKTKDFWKIASRRRALKRETKDYVPKYLAAMIIAKAPEKYGFYGLNYVEPISYDKVIIRRATDLKVLAKAAGTTVKELKRLNPELKRWFTPPNYPEYELKIPSGSAELFMERMKTIPPPDRLRFHTHRVKKGETLSHIARKYRTSIRPIMYLNNLKSARFIRAGSTLVVPVREKKPRATKRPALSRSPSRRIPKEGLYTVKKGDTLWAISMRFGVDMESVLQWNDLNESDLILPGQKLYLKEAHLKQDSKTSLQ
jgi:membrane-bound lytic murein transglycosylase D